MSAFAQVIEFAVGMTDECHAVGVRDAVQNLYLVGIVRHQLGGGLSINLTLYERRVGTNGRAHVVLYLLEIVGSERLRHIEVVVEAIPYRRAYRQLRLRYALQHRLRQHMSGGVAYCITPSLLLFGSKVAETDAFRFGVT